MKTTIQILGFCVVSLIVLSCAQQVSPRGGVKDVTSPQIQKSSPDNFSLNFSGTTLELKFDEFVQLKNINQQMVITPSIKGDIDPKLNGKKVTINLGDSLERNTTYQINFGEGIVDWTEGNPLDSNLFVFSTGDYLDSLFVKGVVNDAFTHLPVEDVIVMLYANGYDSIPYNEIPTYFTRTNSSGNFELNYLKEGSYKVFALKETNNNYLFDNQEELVAYTENLTIPQDSAELNLTLFQEEVIRNQYVESAKVESFGKVRILLNEPAIDFRVNVLNTQFKKAWNILDVYTMKDTIDLWLTDIGGLDSLTLEIIDSIPLDTFYLEVKSLENDSILKVSFNGNSAGFIAPFVPLKMIFGEPLLDPNMDSVKMFRLSDSTFIDVKIAGISDNQREMELSFDKQENEAYEISFLPGQFKSIYGSSNDSILKKITVIGSDKFSILNLELNLDSLTESAASYVLQLLDDNKKVIREKNIDDGENIMFEHLPSGEFSAVLIFDNNKNGKWDTGNYLNRIAPEKVVAFDGIIEIKAGWDQDITWILKE